MALSIKDGTEQKTLDILSGRFGFPVGYARITSSYVNRDDPSYTCVIGLWTSIEHYTKNPRNPVKEYAFGSTLKYPEDFDKMDEGTFRGHLYKHVEYIIHYENAKNKSIQEKEAFNLETENEKLAATEKRLGITSLFHLQ